MIVAALATLLSGTTVLANTNSSNAEQAQKCYQNQTYETQSWFKSHLDSLVSSGTLTLDQVDTIQSAVPKISSDKGQFNRGHHYGQYKTLLNDLVKAGTITEAQKDAINSALKPVKEAKKEVTPTTPVEEATPEVTPTTPVEEAKKEVTPTTPIEEATPVVTPTTPVEEAVQARGFFNTILDGLVRVGVITQAQLDGFRGI